MRLGFCLAQLARGMLRCFRRLVTGAVKALKSGGIMTVKRFAKLQPTDLNTLLSGLTGPTAAGRCAVIREALDKLLELAAKEVVAVAAPAPSAGEGLCLPLFALSGTARLCLCLCVRFVRFGRSFRELGSRRGQERT